MSQHSNWVFIWLWIGHLLAAAWTSMSHQVICNSLIFFFLCSEGCFFKDCSPMYKDFKLSGLSLLDEDFQGPAVLSGGSLAPWLGHSFFFLIGVELHYNGMLVSAVQEVNQLFVHTYPLPMGLPPGLPPSPYRTHLGHHRAFFSLNYF